MIVKRIVTNKVKCLLCDTIVESEHRHHFVSCKCGNIAADGGKEYIRRIGNGIRNRETVQEMNETYEEEIKSEWEK